MKIKCPRCQAALIFDVESQSMECQYCGSIFGIEDLKEDIPLEEESYVNQNDLYKNDLHIDNRNKNDYLNGSLHNDGLHNDDFAYQDASLDNEDMSCKMFSCSSCGATLMVNETESATFCAYCGQPSLVVDRISKQKRPKYILPFKIKKEEAETIVRNRFKNGFFVPDDVKNFKTEKLNGVYIPYRLFDVYCQSEMLIRAEHNSGKHTSYSYHYRKLLNTFRNITVDASDMLNNESSERLEPFNLDEMVPFETEYLSGFYANCMDSSLDMLESIAKMRTKELFDEKAIETVKTGSSKSIIKGDYFLEAENNTYVMLPAWFLSFRQNGKNYTMMVNGQTGKCIGAVPPVKAKVTLFMGMLTVLISLLTIPIGFGLGGIDLDEDSIKLFMYILAGIVVLFLAGRKNFKNVEKSIKLSTSSNMKSFANDRQEV